MTDRLYYTDAEIRSFDAVVQTSDPVDGRIHVVLDRTAFYPTSGGQPFASRFRFSDTFVREGGGGRAVYIQVTRMAE